MELQDFINNIAALFEETEVSLLNASTEFKTLDEWSSLTALSIIAMVDDEYGIKVKGEDIRSSETLEDLFTVIKAKK